MTATTKRPPHSAGPAGPDGIDRAPTRPSGIRPPSPLRQRLGRLDGAVSPYAAKLRFRGKGVLLVVVIATIAVPTQLGIVPLFIVVSKLGWIGSLAPSSCPRSSTRSGCSG